MAEPTTTATTLALGAAAIPVITVLGVPLGLRADVLLAGFFGACAAIIWLNSVPGRSDTLVELLKTSFSRIVVAIVSAVTAGYLEPLITGLLYAATPNLPKVLPGLDLAIAFGVGGGAQQLFKGVVARLESTVEAKPKEPEEEVSP